MEKFDVEAFRARNVCTNFYDSTFHAVGKMIHTDEELQQKIREAVKGKRVIELGCNNTGRYCVTLLALLGADSYVGVDPFYAPDADGLKEWFKEIGHPELTEKDVRYVVRDAASYLQSIRSKGKERVATFSSGVLESSIIFDKDYAREAVREIARLTRPESSAIHVTDRSFTDLFQEEGLLLDFGRTLSDNITLGIYSRAA